MKPATTSVVTVLVLVATVVVAAVDAHAMRWLRQQQQEQEQEEEDRTTSSSTPRPDDVWKGYEVDAHVKVCLVPGPCFKKKLLCPKKCSKLPGYGDAAAADGHLLKTDHFPGKCVFNCKKCVAHC